MLYPIFQSLPLWLGAVLAFSFFWMLLRAILRSELMGVRLPLILLDANMPASGHRANQGESCANSTRFRPFSLAL